LLARGDTVTGVDTMTDYCDVRLKAARLAQLAPHDGFRFQRVDVADKTAMFALFDGEQGATQVGTWRRRPGCTIP